MRYSLVSYQDVELKMHNECQWRLYVTWSFLQLLQNLVQPANDDVIMQFIARTGGTTIYKHLMSIDVISSIVKNILALKWLKVTSATY